LKDISKNGVKSALKWCKIGAQMV